MVMSCKSCKFLALAEAPGLRTRPCGGILPFIMQHGVHCCTSALHCSIALQHCTAALHCCGF